MGRIAHFRKTKNRYRRKYKKAKGTFRTRKGYQSSAVRG